MNVPAAIGNQWRVLVENRAFVMLGNHYNFNSTDDAEEHSQRLDIQWARFTMRQRVHATRIHMIFIPFYLAKMFRCKKKKNKSGPSGASYDAWKNTIFFFTLAKPIRSHTKQLSSLLCRQLIALRTGTQSKLNAWHFHLYFITIFGCFEPKIVNKCKSDRQNVNSFFLLVPEGELQTSQIVNFGRLQHCIDSRWIAVRFKANALLALKTKGKIISPKNWKSFSAVRVASMSLLIRL